MPFEKFGFSVMDQAFCAYSGLVGLEDGMPVVKGEFGTGVYCGPKSHFNLFGRQFRAVPLPLALILLVLFLLPLQGIAGEGSADQITGPKAEQQAAYDRRGGREASVEPPLQKNRGDDAENGREKKGDVFHDWMPTLQMACMLVLCFAVGWMNIMLDNKSQIIKNQEKDIDEITEKYNFALNDQKFTNVLNECQADKIRQLYHSMGTIEEIVKKLQDDLGEIFMNSPDVTTVAARSRQKIDEAMACIRCLKKDNENSLLKDIIKQHENDQEKEQDK